MDRSAIPVWQPWTMLAAIAFPLHWVWEMAQSPLYAGMPQRPWYDATRLCTIASTGDVAITLIAYAIVASGVKGRFWALRPLLYRSRSIEDSTTMREIVLYLAIGIAVTATLEFLNISMWHRWEYSAAMPRLLGLGVAPLGQWIIVPVLIVWLARRTRLAHFAQDRLP